MRGEGSNEFVEIFILAKISMPNTLWKMSFEEWEEKYRPIRNPNADDMLSADMFETYGQDLDFVVKQANEKPNTVWTVENCDGKLVVCAGSHHVNRMYYFITETPWDDKDIEVNYCDEDI